MVKTLPANAGDTREESLIHGLGRSLGVENSKPFQYSCLENPMDRSLAVYSPWGHKESDITEQLSIHHLYSKTFMDVVLSHNLISLYVNIHLLSMIKINNF